MKNNDDMLTKQGDVYILVDQDGYLVREDVGSGSRERYPLSGGESYNAGSGLILSGTTFSIDETLIPTKNNVNDFISNKANVKVDTVVSDYSFELKYDSDYKVFINEVTPSSSLVEIEPIDFTDESLQNGDVASFENWINTTLQANIETLSIDDNITVVGEIPETLSGTLTHVFVRRVYKDANGNIHEAISYAYSF